MCTTWLVLKKIKAKGLPLKKEKKKVSPETRKGEEAKDNALCIAIGREISTLGMITTERTHEKTDQTCCISDS